MTSAADDWLSKLATENETPKVDAPPRSNDPLPVSQDRGRGPRMVKASTALFLALLLLMAGFGAAVFVFSQTMSGTVNGTPVSGPSSLSIGNVPACTANCNITITNGGAYAVLFSVTAVNAQGTSSDAGFSSLWLAPMSGVCSTGPGSPNFVQIPQTMGAITVVAQQYKYCAFYSSLTGGENLNIQVSYSV